MRVSDEQAAPTGETKWTMLGVSVNGEYHTFFVRGDLCKDGKVRVSQETLVLAQKLVGFKPGSRLGIY